MDNFGTRLKEIRTDKNITQKQMASDLGVSQTAIALWESGAREPKMAMLKRMSAYFNMSMSDMMGFDKKDILTDKDEKDIAKDVDNIMAKLASGEDGPASYNGEALDPEAADLFRDELQIALRRLKIVNKEKYTAKKYKAADPDQPDADTQK